MDLASQHKFEVDLPSRGIGEPRTKRVRSHGLHTIDPTDRMARVTQAGN